MQDPDRRRRRARCAALIQDCRVHEWSWNAPSLFSKHQRAVAPRRSRVASSPEGRSVGAPCERSGRSSKLHLSFGIRGAARRTSLPFFTTIRAMQHGPTPRRSRSTRAVAVVVVVVACRSWCSLKHLGSAGAKSLATRPEGQRSSSPIRPPLRSPAALLRPSGEQPLDAIQHELVVVRPLQRRPDLT